MGHGGSSVLPQWEKAKRVLAVCKFLESLWIRQKKKQQKNGSLGFNASRGRQICDKSSYKLPVEA